MSRFRILVEELLEGFYDELGDMVLDERLVSFNSPVAKLVNKLEEELTSEGIEVKVESIGRDLTKKDEIVSYYLKISTVYSTNWSGCPLNIPLVIRKCRCSTHDKINQEANPPRDISLYIPNPAVFKKDRNGRGGMDVYNMSNDVFIDDYVKQGCKDIKETLRKIKSNIITRLNQVTKEVFQYLLTTDDSQYTIATKYPFLDPIIYQGWFQDWLTLEKEKRL